MKKRIVKLMSALCAFSMMFTLAACGENPAPSPAASSAPAQSEPAKSAAESYEAKAYTLSITTGSTGGSWYAAGAAFSEILQDYLPGSNITVLVGGGISNPTLVASGEAEIGFTYSPALIAALAGTGEFPAALSTLRAIGRMEPCLETCFATVESGITSFDQIRDEKIPVRLCVPAVGNFGEAAANAILTAYGLSYEMIESFGGTVQHVSHPEAIDLFRDGHIDMYMCAAGIGHASVTEMCLSRPMKFIPVEGEAMTKLEELGYAPSVVPAGSFEGVTEDCPAAQYNAVWIVNEDCDDALVYYATKALNERMDDMVTAYSAIAEVEKADMTECFGAKLHPAAEAYYKEIGML